MIKAHERISLLLLISKARRFDDKRFSVPSAEWSAVPSPNLAAFGSVPVERHDPHIVSFLQECHELGRLHDLQVWRSGVRQNRWAGLTFDAALAQRKVGGAVKTVGERLALDIWVLVWDASIGRPRNQRRRLPPTICLDGLLVFTEFGNAETRSLHCPSSRFRLCAELVGLRIA